MNPQTAWALTWSALIINGLGVIVTAIGGQFTFSLIAVILALFPTIFARKKAQVFGGAVLVLSLGLVITGYPKYMESPYMQRAKEYAENDCADTVEQWDTALYQKDVATAEALTSNTSLAYLDKEFGGIEGLAKIYPTDTNPCNYEEPSIESVNKATVKYVCTYPDGKRKLWRDTCYKEDGMWKVAPQHVQMKILK